MSISKNSADIDAPQAREAYRQTLLGQIDERVLSRRLVVLLFAIGIAAALIVPTIQFVDKIQEVDVSLFREGGTRHRTALGRWLPTAELLLNADNTTDPYGPGHWFPTPPLMLLTIAPLAKLGYVGAAIVWAAAKIVGFVLGMWLIVTGLSQGGFRAPVGVLMMAAVYSLRPIVSDITHGNLNIFMMVWLAIAWGLFVRRHDFWAGVFLALAVATKLTPALAIVYFAWKRQWRVLIGAGIGLVAFFIVIPGAILGFETNWAFLRSWFEMLVAPFALHGYATLEIENQSLYGVFLRVLSNAGILPIEHMSTEMALQVGMEEMARPMSTLGRLLKPAISLPVLVALAFVCRTKAIDRRDVRLLLEFSMVLLAMLLLSERTWKHHATTLPIIFTAVWFALTCRPLTDRFRAVFVGGLVVQLVLLLFLSEGILPDRVADRMLDGGVFCWGLVLCFVQTGVLLRTLSPRSMD